MTHDVYKAIADPTRRQILNMLVSEKLNLNSVADHFDISRPAVSRHIKVLTECGLVVIEQQGRERYCQADVSPLEEVEKWIGPMKKKWEMRFNQLDELLSNLKSKK